jgi:hypothetical protein
MGQGLRASDLLDQQRDGFLPQWSPRIAFAMLLD